MSFFEFGTVTQCIAPQRVNDRYLTNVLLKINAKIGGINSLLLQKRMTKIPLVSESPIIILGMDISHGSPRHSNVPSTAAVVGSRQWPSISRYKACVRTQSPKVGMIDSLSKPAGSNDDKIIRDGVSESQFNQDHLMMFGTAVTVVERTKFVTPKNYGFYMLLSMREMIGTPQSKVQVFASE
ncbi:uncharacterized protein A4U43_C09F8590 [Asparagus officinalis]|uniref:Piwi domain-containing protein n=1 Tax=Asparagus officinalis TaxID=4686 RepID=A0A5P1E9I8_ASPOF|nr:uncharacterized protein A4U43_C09F8590 [Asparagus officinalis]